ncbi:MAG: hypothetical protein WC483_03915 [Candidatus Paceibacterota bacterium]
MAYQTSICSIAGGLEKEPAISFASLRSRTFTASAASLRSKPGFSGGRSASSTMKLYWRCVLPLSKCPTYLAAPAISATPMILQSAASMPSAPTLHVGSLPS